MRLLDSDGDGVILGNDAFPYDGAAWKDYDGDGKPDELVGKSSTGLMLDDDCDNDGVSNDLDVYPFDGSKSTADVDVNDDGKDDTSGKSVLIIAVSIGILVLILIFTISIILLISIRKNKQRGR
jgi:hypothetical protein